jgi:nitrate reductase NapAB chaperone NapD
MPVSGYTLRVDPRHNESTLNSINSLPSVEVGGLVSGGWPVVTATATVKECKDLAEQIRQVPGVISLTLVYHNFEDQPEGSDELESY